MLLGACLVILAVFAVIALAKVFGGTAGPQAVTPSLSWFNPFGGDASGALAVGLLLTVFLYWGWDVPSAVVEEADGGSKTSGRAMLVSAITLLALYGIVVVALQAYAGVGTTGIGLANEEIADDVLGVIAADAVGAWMGPLMEFAVFASALGVPGRSGVPGRPAAVVDGRIPGAAGAIRERPPQRLASLRR